MKVGIIIEPLNHYLTGIGNYTLNLVKELNSLGMKEKLVLINSKDNSFFDNKKIIINNPLAKVSGTYLWYPYVTKRLKGYHLDIIHNPGQVPTFFKFKQKYVITVHDLTPFIVFKEHKFVTTLIYKMLFPRTLKTADIIIADSYSTKMDITKHFKVPEEKIRVIYLGVDENYRPLSEYEVRKVKLKYNLDFPFILFVGTIEPRKNILTLLKAFYKLKKRGFDQRLVLVGKKGWKYKHIFKLIGRPDLQKDVILTGYVSREDLPALYNAADLFVYPSLYEGFGLPPLEAMACGTPVITSNTSSLPEVVGNAGILVDPYDTDGLAKAIYEVLTNEELRKDLSKRGLERAKMFSWKKTAEETLRVYKEVYNKE